MKRKRITFAAALAALAVLGGCSKSGPSGGGPAQINMDNFNPVGQLPIVKEKESFTILADDSHRPDKTMFEIFEKETNIHVNLMIYPIAVAAERKNILFASGDYPEVIGGWIVGGGDIMKLSADEVIVPLEEIIEKYCPNILEALNLPGVRADMTLPDGHIYSPPYPIEEPLVTFNPWINAKWLNQLGLPMPATTGEFKQTLIAFRDRIQNVAGQKIIPLSWNPNQMSLGVMAGYWGLNVHDTFVMLNGQLETAINKPEYKAFLKWFAELYAENLVDKEIFTQDYTTFVAKGKLGLYGAAYSYWPDDFAPKVSGDLTKNQWDFEALPVLSAPGDAKPVYWRSTWGVTNFRNQMIITDKAKNPITIMRWLDHVYAVENSLQCQYGPIGMRFEKLADGQYQEIDTSNWSDEEKDKYSGNNNYVWSLPKFMRREFKPLPPPGRERDYDPKIVSDALYEPYLEPQRLPNLWITGEDNEKIAEISQTIGRYVTQKIAEWISGQADIDAEWDRYTAELDRLGIQEWLQIQRKYMK